MRNINRLKIYQKISKKLFYENIDLFLYFHLFYNSRININSISNEILFYF